MIIVSFEMGSYFNMRIKTLFLVPLLATSCSSVPKGYKLPEFSYNGKFQNSRIEFRIPDYGDGHRDGCLEMSEMFLAVSDSAADFVNGLVRDVRSSQPIINANISVLFAIDSVKSRRVSDSIGAFKIPKRGKIDYITINSVGYRPLVVIVSGKKSHD